VPIVVRNLNKKVRFRTTIGTFSKDKTQIQPKQTLKADPFLPSAFVLVESYKQNVINQ